MDDSIIGKTFFDKYKILRKIGEGTFSTIYEAEYNNEKLALKFEKKSKGYNLLQNEAILMKYLQGSKSIFLLL